MRHAVVYSTGGGRSALALVGATVAGVCAGAVVPALSGFAGVATARAFFAGTVALGILAARGSGAAGLRTVIAAAAGVLAGVAGTFAPPGVEVALLGLGVGLAVSPETIADGFGPALGRALASAAGALAGAALVVPVLSLSSRGLDPRVAAATLGALTALGIGVAEHLRTFVVASALPPPEVERARAELAPEARGLVDAAAQGWNQLVLAASRGGLGGDDEQKLTLGRELLATTARASLEARDLDRAARALDGSIDPTCERMIALLERRASIARGQAQEAAARLVELAAGPEELAPVKLALVPKRTSAA